MGRQLISKTTTSVQSNRGEAILTRQCDVYAQREYVSVNRNKESKLECIGYRSTQKYKQTEKETHTEDKTNTCYFLICM